MSRFITLTIALLLFAGSNLLAKCTSCDNGCADCAAAPACGVAACDDAGTCCCRPKCVSSAELVDVEGHCWKIECEEICVPKVRFPWEKGGNKLTLFSWFHKHKGKCSGCSDAGCDSCCDDNSCVTCVPPKCGFVRTVRDLKKEKTTSQACEYSLERVKNGGCDGCDKPGCAGCAQKREFTQNHRLANKSQLFQKPSWNWIPQKLKSPLPVSLPRLMR